MIRLAVRCRPELAERGARASCSSWSPGGVEEEARRRSCGRVRDLRAAGRAPRAPRPRGRGRRRAGRDQLDRDPRRLGRPLARLPRAGRGRRRADRGPAVVGDGPSRARPRPSPEAKPRRWPGIDVVIDPGQAFGTGAHATTRHVPGAAARARRRGRAAGPLADLGTGSGVLAIAAAKLGFAPVSACDSELGRGRGGRRERRRQRGRARARAPQPARAAAAAGADRRRQPDRAAAARGRRPDRGIRPSRWSAPGCSRPRSTRSRAALARRRARGRRRRGARATGPRCCAAGFRRRRGIGCAACRRSP